MTASPEGRAPTTADVVVVPSSLLLLPRYAGLTDPVPELRTACRDAVSWLVGRHPDRVAVLHAEARPDNVDRGVAEAAGARVARQLLDDAGFRGVLDRPGDLTPGGGLLVVANGSATRSEKAPGHLDPRSLDLDAAIGRALAEGDPAALRALDDRLGAELWAHDVPALRLLGRLVAGPAGVTVDHADDPFGVQYWVVRWTCGS